MKGINDMEYILEYLSSIDLRGLNEISIALRLVLAVICGGLIGIERESKHRPAGFRTHTLVCLGASLTVMTSQYLLTLKHLSPDNFVADPARLGAQVIAGIGFIGAGTIIVTKRRQVKGLTTAAGLWASAIMGLAIGVGCYEVALYATFLILVAELVFAKIEWRIVKNARDMNIYVEILETSGLTAVIDEIKKNGASVVDVEIAKSKASDDTYISAIFSLAFDKKADKESMMAALSKISGLKTVEEL